jgi:hypothetical protein
MRLRATILAAALAAGLPGLGRADTSGPGLSASVRGAIMARIDSNYAVVMFPDGRRSLVPLTELKASDRAFLDKLAAEHPLGHGNSKLIVVGTPLQVKKTIEKQSIVGPLETVQLCPPALPREQIGNTCELYAIVHTMDIAGYYVEVPEIYKIVNMVEASSPKDPWADPRYAPAVFSFPLAHAPRSAIHYPSSTMDPFDWARAELRKGHPVLAGFPETIWAALPPKFVAAHEWDGGKVGHAIVINGFTYNKDTKQGTFHIINSWNDLQDFDLTTERARGLLDMQWSMSAKNEIEPAATKEVVVKVFLIRKAGDVFLYDVETNLGSHRVAAPSEAEARRIVEEPPASN